MAEAAKTGMAMHYFDSFSYYDVAEDREEGEDGRHGRLAVDDQEWDMVHFEAICEIVNPSTALVRMCDYDDLVAPVNELRGQLVDVALDAAELRKEKVADHSNVVRHRGQRDQLCTSDAQILEHWSFCSILSCSHLMNYSRVLCGVVGAP